MYILVACTISAFPSDVREREKQCSSKLPAALSARTIRHRPITIALGLLFFTHVAVKPLALEGAPAT